MSPYRATFLALFLALPSCSGSSDKTVPSDPELQPPPDSANAETALFFAPDTLRTLEVEVAPSESQAFASLGEGDNPLNGDLERFFPATVRYEGESFSGAAIRYKGDYGSLYSCFMDVWPEMIGRDCDKLNFKLKFNEYDDSRRFYGLKRLNLHAMDKDYSRTREALAYRVFREFDLPASRTTYLKLFINGEYRGLYLAVEAIDGHFIKERFDDADGNLYKEVWFDQTVPLIWRTSLETNEDEAPDVSPMADMATELASAKPADFRETLERWVDVEQLLKYVAVERTIGHWDSTMAFYCDGSDGSDCTNHNYYLYQSTAQNRVTLLPWDLDLTFGNFGVPNVLEDMYHVPKWNDLDASCEPVEIGWGYAQAPSCNRFVANLLATYAAEIGATTRDLLDTVFATERLQSWIDESATLIEPAVTEDAFGPTLAEWRAEVDRFKAQVGEFRTRAEQAVEPE